MNNLFIYLLQATSIFVILYLVYRLFFKQLTFHRLNRYFLLLLIPASLLIPLTNSIFPSMTNTIVEVPPFFENITFENITTSNVFEKPVTNSDSASNYFSIFIVLYCIGVLICFSRSLFTIRKLILLKRKATIYHKKDFKIVVTNVSEIFSYFNWIFVPEEKQKKYDELIIEHEKVHIKLNHSLDLIFTELYIAFFWFNPVVYFYRKSLKSVHEFQADNGVLKKQIKTSHYMQLLLQSLDLEKPNNLYSYFNHPILKKRIDMMMKTKSKKIAKLKYLVLLPVCALFLAAFTKSTIKSESIVNKVINRVQIESLPPSLFPVQNGSTKDIVDSYGTKHRHPKLKVEKIHGGIDIRAVQGTPVIATADGIISKASMEGNWGNLIVMTHTGGYETWYAHLKGFNSIKNQQVKKGEIIGYVGNTGLSTGPHLHYEVKLNGKRVNPINYFDN